MPRLTRAEVVVAVTALAPGSAGPSRPPELVVLPTAGGAYVLAYRARVFDGSQLVVHYLDASTRRRRAQRSGAGRPTASRTLIACSRPSAECVDVTSPPPPAMTARASGSENPRPPSHSA